LHIAAQAGNLEVVKLLVEYGASLTAKTYRGSTAENLADQRHREAVAAFLKAEREKVSGAGPGAGKS
jgi:ankyrin repeat protein